MIRKYKRFFLPVTMLLALVVVLGGCNSQPAPTTTSPTTSTPTTTAPVTSEPSPTTPEPEELSGTITEAGSTTVQPVAELLAAAFMVKYPEIEVVIQGGGSSLGVKSATEGTVDIGAASRELKSAEVGAVVNHVLARDGIAIVTHSSQVIDDLTKEQVMEIFAGEITNWSELGGADEDINVVAREEGSGTRTAFEEMVR